MKKHLVTIFSILFGVSLIVGGFYGREWVLTPKTEFKYSVYARDAAVDYGLDYIDTSKVTSTPEELTDHYIVGVEQEMQEFANKYGSAFGISDPKELLATIQSDHHKVRTIPFDDRQIVVFGWSLADFHTSITANPNILVHRGYLPFTPEVWGYIFIGFMVVGLLIVLQAVLLYLRLSGALVPLGFKEVKSRIKDKISK